MKARCLAFEVLQKIVIQKPECEDGFDILVRGGIESHTEHLHIFRGGVWTDTVADRKVMNAIGVNYDYYFEPPGFRSGWLARICPSNALGILLLIS